MLSSQFIVRYKIIPRSKGGFNSLRPRGAYMRKKLTITDAANILSPGRRLAIIWATFVILSNGLTGTNFNEILI